MRTLFSIEKMKTRYKISIVATIIFGVYFALASWQVCIFSTESQEWLGSHGGCGPGITFAIQRFFENVFIS